MSTVVEVVLNGAEEMYFYAGHEIQKPKQLAFKVGKYVAFSPPGSDGRGRFFRADQVINVKDMEIQY